MYDDNLASGEEFRFRTSLSQMLCKIGVLKNFAKFKEKHLCWNLLKQGCRPATLLKNDFSIGVFL